MSATPRIATAILVFVGGCFNPDPSKVTFKCDAEHACPESMVCIANLCAQPGNDAGNDAGVVDQGTDGAVMSGCADKGGFPLGMSAYACPGTFAMGQASGRCAAGWQPCTSGLKVDLTACNALDGFFVANVPASWIARAQPNCGTGAGNPAWYGCGDKPAAKSYVAAHDLFKCSDFAKSLDCPSNTAARWECPLNLDLQKTINKDPVDGILCCR